MDSNKSLSYLVLEHLGTEQNIIYNADSSDKC